MSRTYAKTFNQLLTGSAPTLATDGISLSDAEAYAVVVSAESTRTITGGTAVTYFYMPVSAVGDETSPTFAWVLAPTSFTFTPATGARHALSGDFQVMTGVGRVKVVPNGITASGGTTADVTLIARRRK